MDGFLKALFDYFIGKEPVLILILFLFVAVLLLIGFEYKSFKFKGIINSLTKKPVEPSITIKKNEIIYSGDFLLCEDSSKIDIDGPRNYIKRLSEDDNKNNDFIVFNFLQADAIISRVLGLIIEVSKSQNIQIQLLIKEKHFSDIGVIYRSPEDYKNIDYQVEKDGFKN